MLENLLILLREGSRPEDVLYDYRPISPLDCTATSSLNTRLPGKLRRIDLVKTVNL